MKSLLELLLMKLGKKKIDPFTGTSTFNWIDSLGLFREGKVNIVL